MTLSCLEFRQVVGAEPGSRDPAVLEHRLQCRACAAFAEEQAALDRRLEAALRIPVPDDLKARVIWSQAGGSRRRTWHWMTMAAGIVLAALVGIFAGQIAGSRSLPAEIVRHIEHEPARLVFDASTRPAEAVKVSAVLENGGVDARQPLENVISAGLCPFRGHDVPHLVMRVDGEPVSVLLLADEPLRGTREFHEDGYHGVLIPHDDGAIAIVAPRPELIRPVRAHLEETVQWRL
ncbi:MAG TPA: DUF3379 family protein [Gammaproteobacteria bacterium]